MPIDLRRRLLDVAPTMGLITLGVVGLLTDSGSYLAPRGTDLAFLIATCLPLLVRRRRPFAALVATFAVSTAWTFAYYPDTQPPFEPFAAGIVACFALGFHAAGADLRRGIITYAVIASAMAAGMLALGQAAGNVIPALIWWTASIGIGRMLHEREGLVLALRDRSERLEREREQERVRAALEERARIARELHDVIAHAVSLIVVQAGAERRMLGPGSERTTASLQTIEDAGREALGELRRLLGVLRTSADTRLAPQPGLASLEQLLTDNERSGQTVALRSSGDATTLAPGLDLVAYRIIQEALTNTRKHAPGAAASIHLAWGAEDLRIDVSDDGPGPSGASGPIGHGLIGMRERASLYGGDLDIGPGDGGGFRVRARLPLDGGARL